MDYIDKKEDLAATKIQASYRGHMVRKRIKDNTIFVSYEDASF